MDEDDVLIAVHEIHHRLGGVAEREKVGQMIKKKRRKYSLEIETS